MSAESMPAGRGIAQLATVPDSERRDGGPELVIRGEHPWLVSSRQAVPVLPRRRDQIREPVTCPSLQRNRLIASFVIVSSVLFSATNAEKESVTKSETKPMPQGIINLVLDSLSYRNIPAFISLWEQNGLFRNI
jgi:hypothetical protein